MEKNILQHQEKSKYQIGDLASIKMSPYKGIEHTDGIIVSFSETGLAQLICVVRGKSELYAFYDKELINENINPNS